jgi:hypothetical protein
MKGIRKLLPDKDIGEPTEFVIHPWSNGCTYWLPGSYTPETESAASIHPLHSELPNVWLCGESWCLRQAWVEGALEQTYQCLEQMKKTYNR